MNTYNTNRYIDRKVITPSIESYVCGGGYKNFISVIPVDHSKYVLTFIPSVRQHFKSNTDLVSNISVQLVDENDIPINFTIRPPTVTKLRFKEMDNESNTFYVQISNLDSNDIYVDNNRSCFRNKLPKALHLRDKWSVAVSRIYLPPKIMNIANPINIIEFQTQPSDSSDSESYTNMLQKS